LFGGIERVLTPVSNGLSLGARLMCLALLIACFWATRRLMLHMYARKPGPVDVQPFIDAAPQDEIRPPLDSLSATFRKRLSETHLYAPSTLPAEAPAENFMDLLGDLNVEPKKLGTSLVRLFGRLRPRISYRVSGVLHLRAEEPRYGVTVTLTSCVFHGSRAHTVWETSWADAVRTAGYWVVSALLPVTGAGRRAPWDAWWGRSVPYELFAHYQQATELNHDRKFDDALDHYYSAAHLDPTNVYLRTQIGATQEKLGLHLEALESYRGALALLVPDTGKDNELLWIAPWDLRRFANLRLLWNPRSKLLARYRYSIVLGMSEQLAAQWCDADLRSRQGEAFRESLIDFFTDRYWPVVAEYTYKRKLNPEEWLRSVLKAPPDKETIQLVFQLACVQEMHRLSQDYLLTCLLPTQILRRLPARTRARESLTGSALRVCRYVSAPLRLAWAQDQWVARQRQRFGEEFEHRPQTGDWLLLPPSPSADDSRWERPRRPIYSAYIVWPAISETWPWEPDLVAEGVKRALRCRGWQRHNWQDHYNAACAYVIAMHGHSGEEKRDHLAKRAVRELEKAVHSSESGFVHLQRWWLLADDPDLSLLRRQFRFVYFVRQVFPHSTPDRYYRADMNPLQAEMAVYDQRLVHSSAKAMEQTWHRRGGRGSVDVHALITWLEREHELWDALRHFASGKPRDWRDRENLLQKVQSVADPEQMAAAGLPPPVPDFNDEELHITDIPEKELNKRFEDLADSVTTPCTHSERCLDRARHLDAFTRAHHRRLRLRWLSGLTVSTLCARYAAVWQTLPAVLTQKEPTNEATRDFRKAVSRLSRPLVAPPPRSHSKRSSGASTPPSG
jgi:tetratricopeptide (TPR) repeat protein